jgi:hypothetical protein
VDPRILAPQPFTDLRSTPVRPFPLEPDDLLLDLERQLVGVTVRSAAPIGQPLKAAILVTVEDLVASLAGNIEFPAQNRHLLPVEQPRHEPKPFIHLVTLLPRHLSLSRKRAKSVTYVSGMMCNLSVD